MINLITGEFLINDEIKIDQSKTYEEVLQICENKEIMDIGNGYKWIYYKNIEIHNLFFNVNICFFKDDLWCFDLDFTDEQQKNISWDNWNEVSEIKRKEIYDNWLTKIIGKRRKFNWGTIGAYYDPRAGFTSIKIKYK
jgi:hypothetical protein